MLIRYIKKTLHSHKILIFGLLGFIFFLTPFIFCGQFQTMNQPQGVNVLECGITHLITNQANGRGSIFLSVFLFSFIALPLLIKNIIYRHKSIDTFFSIRLIFLKINQLFYKVYNTILEALRRGRLHPKIYNSMLVIS